MGSVSLRSRLQLPSVSGMSSRRGRFRPEVFLLFLAGFVIGGLQAAELPTLLRLRDGHRYRTFEVAQQERYVRERDGSWRMESEPYQVPSGAAPASVPGAVAASEAFPVLYPEGQPHSVDTRRVLSREVLVRLTAGVDPIHVAAAVPGARLKELPAYAPGFALFEAANPIAALDLARALATVSGVLSADSQLERHQELEWIPSDPFFQTQWYLSANDANGGVAGIDLDVLTAWDRARGAGQIIGILDDGVEVTHPDLAANIRPALGYDFLSGDTDPSPVKWDDGHGTAVAGLAAAVSNDIGIAGVANQAGIAAIRLINGSALGDSKIGAALAFRNDVIAVKNNSWGAKSFSDFADYGPLVFEGVKDGIRTGRGGRGVIYIFSAGNNGDEGDNVNYNTLKTNPYILPIAALRQDGSTATYSTPGASVVVGAFGGEIDSRHRALIATDRVGTNGYNTATTSFDLLNKDYTVYFSGTSASAPLVSGVVALMLQANTNLGWRDVQEILIRTAKKVVLTDSDWSTNSAGFAFNHAFGAGLVQAGAAVRLAAAWTNLPPAIQVFREIKGLQTDIPDGSTNGVTQTLTFDGSGVRIEHVLVTLDAVHTSRGQMTVSLISPSGMISRLAEKHPDTNGGWPNWTFLSRRHWGEASTGTWKIKIADVVPKETGYVRSVRIDFLGTPLDPVTVITNQVAESPGSLSNGNGVPDPGETVDEGVWLGNQGNQLLHGVTGTLSSTTPGVSIARAGTSWPDLVPQGSALSTQPFQVKLDRTIPCDSLLEFSVMLEAAGKRITNHFSQRVGLRQFNPVVTNSIVATDTPVAIPDLGTGISSIPVALPGNPILESLTASVRISHTTIGDVRLFLQHPDGTEIRLSDNEGGDFPDMGAGDCRSGQFTVFNDAATFAISDGVAPFLGAFQPEDPLDTFRGKPANGTWKLRATDVYLNDFGTLQCWSLTLRTRTFSALCSVADQAPMVVDHTYRVDQGGRLAGALVADGLVSDAEGDALTFAVTTPTQHGVLTGPAAGTGVFAYTPDPTFSGTDSFRVTANDGFKDSAAALMTITVQPPLITPPVLQVFEFRPDGAFHLRAGNVVGTARLEVSTNLIDWTPLLTNGVIGGTLEFVDPAPGTGPALSRRFYRVRN